MLKIGVLAPSDIAFRRFVPAILKSKEFEYIGVACALCCEWDESKNDNSVILSEYEKAKKFRDEFGGKIFEGYETMLNDPEIEAVYVPLPPGLHFKWGNKVIENKKHLLMEKPFSDSYKNTELLINKAKEYGVAVHENFAFAYHAQIEKINEVINKGLIGEIRLIRTSFGFPYRGKDDFRYYKSLGGGALLDCGGYPTKLAYLLLGDTSRITSSSLCSSREHDVDVFGAATMQNRNGLTAQISFGMDNSYKCELEVWGSKGVLYTPRVFTPTAEMKTEINVSALEKNIVVNPDDQFLHSAEHFLNCINDLSVREKRYEEILKQSLLMNEIRRIANEY